MSAKQTRKNDRDWYSVSMESMRRAFFLLVFVVVLISSAFGFQQWEHRSQKEQAVLVIQNAIDATHQLEDRGDFNQIRREHFAAWDDLEAAREAYAGERYAEALKRGTRSLLEFQQIIQRDEGADPAQGRFLSVQGSVEYRRGDRGSWKRARSQDTVRLGDWVKTSAGGAARIIFPDGAEYLLRSNTLVHLTVRTDRFGRTNQVTEMKFGDLELRTENENSTVTTPKSQAEVRRSSKALVAYDQSRSASRFATVSGSMQVTAENGQTQTVGALQQVVQQGDLLSGPSALPGRPRLLNPRDEGQVYLDQGEIRLAWRTVPGAQTYALEVSPSRLFASKIIADDDRRKTSARLALKSEGVYFWQVAAMSSDGTQGPWSEPRQFEVTQRQNPREDDATPPALRIQDIQTYGRLLIITGRTEPGATLTISGETVELNNDGSFSQTIQMDTEGFVFVELVAQDASGNTSTEQRRVFIDSSY